MAVPRLDATRPWLVALPSGTLAALQLCSVAACGSRDVAWVLASKTPLVAVQLKLLVLEGRGARACVRVYTAAHASCSPSCCTGALACWSTLVL